MVAFPFGVVSVGGSFVRRGLLRLVGALALYAIAVGTACSNDSGGPRAGAGAGGTGGASGTGGNLSCTNVARCGGSVVGTWDVTSSCLKLSGDMDISLGS